MNGSENGFLPPVGNGANYTGSMAPRILEAGQQVRLKTALEPPTNIPAGAIG
jgi:hypothetical protein